MPASGALLSGIPGELPDELFDLLGQGNGVRIERIVSRGHVSPPDFWYDQAEAEWVMVVQGAARLRFREPERVLALGPGDWVDIRPHEAHRVDWTAPDADTVWLAVFYRPE